MDTYLASQCRLTAYSKSYSKSCMTHVSCICVTRDSFLCVTLQVDGKVRIINDALPYFASRVFWRFACICVWCVTRFFMCDTPGGRQIQNHQWRLPLRGIARSIRSTTSRHSPIYGGYRYVHIVSKDIYQYCLQKYVVSTSRHSAIYGVQNYIFILSIKKYTNIAYNGMYCQLQDILQYMVDTYIYIYIYIKKYTNIAFKGTCSRVQVSEYHNNILNSKIFSNTWCAQRNICIYCA